MSGPAGIVSINVIDPLKGREDKALAVLREVVERARSRHSGLVRTRVSKSVDGGTLATHAEWKSKVQLDALLRDDEFARRFNQSLETTTNRRQSTKPLFAPLKRTHDELDDDSRHQRTQDATQDNVGVW
jgi:hypothetical protein